METIVYKNEYMLIHVIKIYNLNYSSSNLVIIRLIINNTKYNSVLRGSEVGMS